MGETALHRRVKRLEFLTGFLAPIPIGGSAAGTEIVDAFEFTPATAPVVPLGGIPAGAIFSQASILIVDPFDDPAASATLGIPTDLALLLGPADSRLGLAGTYSNEALLVVDAPAMLLLSLSLGTSTVGRGYVFFRQLP